MIEIEIRKTYTGYNIYNNGTMIGKNYDLTDINVIIDICKQTKTKYKITDANL